MNITLLQFRYSNWRHEDHKYLVKVEKFEHVVIKALGSRPHWVLHGKVIERDSMPRGGVRRTFKLEGMREIEEVVHHAA